MEISGLWCSSDGISCRLGRVRVMSFFKVYLLFPSKHLTCTDPEKCLWEGKGCLQSTPKEIHTKASCKNGAFLFQGFSPVQWGAEPSSAWPVLFCLGALFCYDSMIWSLFMAVSYRQGFTDGYFCLCKGVLNV